MTCKPNFIKQTEGAAAVIIALSLFALLGVASLAVDMGNLYAVRNELQNVADAATLAGAGQLVQKDASGNAVRDSALATQTAIQVAQTQSQIQGQAAVTDDARNDLTINFGVWDIYNSNPETAWTDLGTSVPGTSTANAMRIRITRETGTAFGPVTSLFAKIFGVSSTSVSATATAFLGYTNEVQTGAIQVPLALPGTGANSPLASIPRSGWFARFFGPSEAVATTTKTLVFKDTGGANVAAKVPTSPVANLDSAQGYWYTGASSDSVPTTITNTLKKIYTPSLTGTTSAPVLVPDLKVGQQIYPRSEYCWGRAYIGPIFQQLQKAYYYKTTGSATTAPAAGTAWRTTLAVHGLKTTASLPRKGGFTPLARLLTLFSPTQAYACATITYPTISVDGVVNVDITGVTYNSTTSDDGNYTYPKTISGVTYTDKKDFLTRYPDSTWNKNTVTITSVTDTSTVSPPGSISGGPPAKEINPSAPTGVGSLATIPRLVK
jgi:Flp pilus assembly protein TadG